MLKYSDPPLCRPLSVHMQNIQPHGRHGHHQLGSRDWQCPQSKLTSRLAIRISSAQVKGKPTRGIRSSHTGHY